MNNDDNQSEAIGYGRPPVEHRFQPGQSGNPKGRPAAGATVREWINVLAEAGHTEAQLREIARDRDAPWPKRTAAERALRTLEAGDIADFGPFLGGEMSIEQLRGTGINTEVVKKAKSRRRIISRDNEKGETVEVEEREIELHDRAGTDFDRIVEQTDGRPRQAVTVDGPFLPMSVESGRPVSF